tara:strand:- start:5048 stop:5341 length:294 start_codon:yes stop_codon:yes gene_type:complete
MADPVTMGIMMAMQAEGMRKQHVAGRIQRETQEEAARKAEERSKAQEARNLMIRQQEAKRKENVQTTPVTKNPFAGGRKDMRSQFTIGGGGESGANY